MPKSTESRSRRGGRDLSSLVVGGVVGAGAALAGFGFVRLLLPASGPEPEIDAVSLWLLIPALVFTLWLVILVHEVGHLVAGRLQGFRFLLLAVGPMWLERGARGLELRFNRILPTWGGLAASSPLDDRDLVRRMATMIVGGPIASLLLGLLALPAFLLARAERLRPVGFFEPITLTLLVGSLAIFLATAFPGMAGKGFRTDGRRWLDLRRGDRASEAEVALLSLFGASMAGVRPRDWSSSLVERAGELDDGSTLESAGALYRHEHHLDLGELEAARLWLRKALDCWQELPSLARGGLAVQAAWFEARHGELQAAREWLARADGPMVEEWQTRLAEAAIAAREGRADEAAQLARRGLEATKRARFTVTAAATERLEHYVGQLATD